MSFTKTAKYWLSRRLQQNKKDECKWTVKCDNAASSLRIRCKYSVRRYLKNKQKDVVDWRLAGMKQIQRIKIKKNRQDKINNDKWFLRAETATRNLRRKRNRSCDAFASIAITEKAELQMCFNWRDVDT